MKLVAVVIAVFVGLCGIAQAYMSAEPLEAMVRESDLIVVGTLEDAQQVTERNAFAGSTWCGMLRVTDVVWGDLRPGARVPVVWRDVPTAISTVSLMDLYTEDAKSGLEPIWLLWWEHGVGACVKDIGWLRPAQERGEIERLLQDNPVRVAPVASAGQPGNPRRMVAIGYRNASASEGTFPGLTYERGRLHLGSPSMTLHLYSGKGLAPPEVSPLAGAIVATPALQGVRVPARSDWSIVVDLEALFGTDYAAGPVVVVEFGVDGLGQPHRFVWGR
jgi:hypothetical protein